jgi:hypothetical protein
MYEVVSSVGKVTGYKSDIQVSIPGKDRDLFRRYLPRPDQLWGQPSFLFSG